MGFAKEIVIRDRGQGQLPSGMPSVSVLRPPVVSDEPTLTLSDEETRNADGDARAPRDQK